MCQCKNVIPKYAKITINGTSKAIKQTQQKATKLRINNEIKYLYAKKQNIKKQLYTLHLKNAHYWQTSWFIIENVNLRLKEETSKHYNTLNNKFNKLIKQSEDK
jgi:hypothetical protein